MYKIMFSNYIIVVVVCVIRWVPYALEDTAAVEALKQQGKFTVTAVEGYVMQDPHEWCRRINAFAAREVLSLFKNNNKQLILC